MKRVIPVLVVSLLLAGCFVTTLNLGNPADAKVDPLFCGDWNMTWKEGDDSKSASMIVRNFDGKQYFVQWTPEGDKPVYMSGFLVSVGDATFVQLSDLKTSAELANEHLIARVRLDGQKLTLRHLDEDFFKDANLQSDAELRKKIEANLNNDAMYDEVVTGSLVSQP